MCSGLASWLLLAPIRVEVCVIMQKLLCFLLILFSVYCDVHTHAAKVKTAGSEDQQKLPLVQVVMFGATGDLSKKYGMGAFLRLFSQTKEKIQWQIVGAARAPLEKGLATVERILSSQPCNHLTTSEAASVAHCLKTKSQFLDSFSYVNVRGGTAAISAMCKGLEGRAKSAELVGRLVFLAIPPSAFGETIKSIRAACGSSMLPGQFLRFIVEKPFGDSLASAQALLRQVLPTEDSGESRRLQYADEVLLVDHYLGKAPLQAFVRFRQCAGGALAAGLSAASNASWRVTAAHISMQEQDEVGSRLGFYTPLGVVRDVVQSHGSQLLASALAPVQLASPPPNTTQAAVGAAAQIGLTSATKHTAESFALPSVADRLAVLRYLTAAGSGTTLSHAPAVAQGCFAHSTYAPGVKSEPNNAQQLPPNTGCAVQAAFGQYATLRTQAKTAASTLDISQATLAKASTTATSVHVAFRLHTGGSPPINVSLSAGKALDSKVTAVRLGVTDDSGSSGHVTVILAGSVEAPAGMPKTSPIHGPAIILQGPLQPIDAIPAGWTVAWTCQAEIGCTAPQAANAPPLDGPQHGFKQCSASSHMRIAVGETVLLLPSLASTHLSAPVVAPPQSRASPAEAVRGAFEAYLQQHAGDVMAAGTGSLGGMQAYATVLAAGLAGRSQWFVSPRDEAIQQWRLWQPIAEASEAVDFWAAKGDAS